MTSEVIIMNRDAIALAADSAVTFQNGKIFNTANKLYMLAPNHKIGVMVFNNAAFMSVSWELLIKLYRDHISQSGTVFDTVEEYGEDFARFIESQSPLLFSDEEERGLFSGLVSSFMNNEIFRYVDHKVERKIVETTASVDGATILGIAQERIDALCLTWEQAKNLFDEEKTNRLEKSLKDKYYSVFESCYGKYLDGLNLDDETKQRLWNTCVFWFTKQNWLNQFSGLVFAGYGAQDLFPSFFRYHYESYMCGVLKYARIDSASAKNYTGVFPLAQGDIIELIISGMHELSWRGLEIHFKNAVKSLYKSLADNTSEDLENAAENVANEEFEDLANRLEIYMREKYSMSIMSIIQGLSKDELALMAETLVNTTSYMRRVSNQLETVGGPTDVAVISKKDGFIWIKRKHYFEERLNHHFFERN